MVIESGLHYRYWAEAVFTEDAFEIWNGMKPDMSKLQVFGTEAYVFIPKEKQTKL